jgi:hypothetical protein
VNRRQRSRVVSLVAYGLAAVCLGWSILDGEWTVILWFVGMIVLVFAFVGVSQWWINRADR